MGPNPAHRLVLGDLFFPPFHRRGEEPHLRPPTQKGGPGAFPGGGPTPFLRGHCRGGFLPALFVGLKLWARPRPTRAQTFQRWGRRGVTPPNQTPRPPPSFGGEEAPGRSKIFGFRGAGDGEGTQRGGPFVYGDGKVCWGLKAGAPLGPPLPPIPEFQN